MNQLGRAELIEDNLPDIVSPDGSTMLSVALNFETSKVGNFVWKEEINATGNKIAMPSQITLSIPVFENGSPYSIEARVKYQC